MATLVSRSEYFVAAIAILSTDGYGSLKLAPLCKYLKVTTGSFYNYFANWQEFKTELLQVWLDERTLQLVEMANTEAEPLRRLHMLVEFSTNLPHRAESAIRAWSHTDPEVREVQAMVDRQRYSVVLGAISGILGDEVLAEQFAHLGLYILTGYEQLEPPQDVAYLRWSLNRIIEDIERLL
ncbi:MAG: TetR/AcrR family transcriptional regulator [Rhodococcus sp. (in: high G+C Gram-positive bacteria)]|uniref:TetR/AcrR family transcriptional regulator n=1 Tax=Rhodococcus sp. TaxID=1831 RepID=UPI003BB1C6FC